MASPSSPNRHRTLGLIGGMSWESTALYYRLLNEGMQARLGGHHNARSVLVTVDFADLVEAGAAGRWDEITDVLVAAARSVERAGAAALLLTANTAHAVAGPVAAAVGIPLLHIADAAGRAVRAAGLRRVGLIGTRPVVEGDFYARHLAERFDIEVVAPAEADRAAIHRIIIEELTLGKIRPEARRSCLDAIDRLARAGAEGIVVGCTELPLLLYAGDAPLPLFDTTRLHVGAALDFALEGTES